MSSIDNLLKISAAVFLSLVCCGASRAQTWQPLQNQPTFPASSALVLTDGTVMVQRFVAREWWRLTPDNSGSYVNGTWTRLASLPSGYGPLYYASAVLPDGRVVVNGGEDNLSPKNQVETNMGAIYDPLADSWTSLVGPAGWRNIGDAQSVVLADGTYMLGNCCSSQQALLNATALTWTITGTGKADSNSEEGWTLLPDGQVLTVDTSRRPNAERYVPKSGSWTSAGNTIVNLVDPGSLEVGPAVLRPDRTVFATGATGHNSIYHPAGPTQPGTWVAGPDFPDVMGQGQLDIADGPAALLPSGNVLCAASPGIFKKPTHFFEFDGTNLIQEPATPNSAHESSFVGRMLLLPTGQVLFTDGSMDVEIYTPGGSPDPAWAPTISSVPSTVTHGQTYVISGTQFNGLSQANAYGDDNQQATNYPLVRITNQNTGHVFYARTHDHSTMAVATGSKPVSTSFDVPAGIELGASSLEVVANGIASTPVAITVN